MHWIEFNERYARRSTCGQVRSYNTIQATWSHTELIINNLTTPAGPLRSAEELRACAKTAVGDATPHRLPWMFGIPEPWLPVSLEETNLIINGAGLRHLMYMSCR